MSVSTQLWHQRLGHMSERGLQVLMNRKLLPYLKSMDLMFCRHCIFGNYCTQKFKAGSHVSKGVLEYTHSDLCGRSPTIFYGGATYYVLYVDEFYRNVWVYVLKRKVDVFNTFRQFRLMVEKRTCGTIKCLRTDNGGEFTSLEFEKYCKDEGIVRHKTNVYTPQQNGIAERMNKTLLERARSMLINSNMGQELWVEAVSTTCYLIN